MVKKSTGASRLTKVAHVGMIVKDINKTVAQLTPLGIGPFLPMTLHAADAKRIKISNARIGEVGLELLQPLERGTVWEKFLAAKGNGIHHLGFMVDNLDEALAEMNAAGAETLLVSRRPTGGIAYVVPKDGGLIIELLQR